MKIYTTMMTFQTYKQGVYMINVHKANASFAGTGKNRIGRTSHMAPTKRYKPLVKGNERTSSFTQPVATKIVVGFSPWLC